jgi:hexosaminidase
VQTSDDGKIFKTIAEKNVPIPASDGAIPFSILWPKNTARYLRIIAEPLGKIPAGNTGAGDDAWLFVDEISVN